MATNLTVNGTVFAFPGPGADVNWGAAATGWAVAVTNGMLSKAGGLFSLTSDTNFGTNFGLKSIYYISGTANPAATGILRLANADGIGFRNSGNSADILLQPDADGFLKYNSIDLANISSAQTLTSKTLSGASNTFSAIPYASLILTGGIVNADINATAAIANSKLATMAANTVKANVTGGAATPTDVALVSAATASAAMIRDANANTQLNNLIKNLTSTASAAGTTTLTNASSYNQLITGATTQTVVLPDCTTLALGFSFIILNRSSGVVTVNANGGGLVQTVAASGQVLVTCTNIGSAAGAWDSNYSSPSGTGTVTSVAMTVPAFLSIAGSPVTTSGTLAVSLSGTALPVANGGTAKTSVTTAPAASSWVGWDANSNVSAKAHISGYSTTATAAGTTTLVVGSNFQQYFTGVTTQTVKLPVTSTLVLGQQFQIINNSTGNVTVQSSGANSILVLAGSTIATFTCILTSGTTAASWSSVVTSASFVPAFFTSSAISGLSSAISTNVYATFNNSPAFTFTPTVSGTYKVYCGACIEADGGGTASVTQIINTTGGATVLTTSTGLSYSTATSIVTHHVLQTVFTLTAGVSYVFDIQGKTVTGSCYLNAVNNAFYMFAERVS